jgi:hypothetical protein
LPVRDFCPIFVGFFPGDTGGTSADMTTITGFHGDVLEFDVGAWNGGSSKLG